MSSSVYFKYSHAKESEPVCFSGHQIKVIDLKRSIVDLKNLKGGMDFDLKINDADNTTKVFSDEDYIPKNTTVIVKRTVVTNGNGLLSRLNGKIFRSTYNTLPQKSEKPIIISAKPDMENDSSLAEHNVDTSKEDEELRLLQNMSSRGNAAKIGVNKVWTADDLGTSSTQQTAGTRNNPTQVQRKTLPPGYECYRCGRGGHAIKDCPTNGDPAFDIPRGQKREGATVGKLIGVPVSSIKVVSAVGDAVDGGGEGGKAVEVLEPSSNGLKRLLNQGGGASVGSVNDVDMNNLPNHLKCALTGHILRNAVRTPCCHKNTNGTIMRDALLKTSKLQCPLCNAIGVSPDALLPMESLRREVEEFLAGIVGSKSSSKSNAAEILIIDNHSNDNKSDLNRDDLKVSSMSANFYPPPPPTPVIPVSGEVSAIAQSNDAVVSSIPPPPRPAVPPFPPGRLLPPPNLETVANHANIAHPPPVSVVHGPAWDTAIMPLHNVPPPFMHDNFPSAVHDYYGNPMGMGMGMHVGGMDPAFYHHNLTPMQMQHMHNQMGADNWGPVLMNMNRGKTPHAKVDQLQYHERSQMPLWRRPPLTRDAFNIEKNYQKSMFRKNQNLERSTRKEEIKDSLDERSRSPAKQKHEKKMISESSSSRKSPSRDKIRDNSPEPRSSSNRHKETRKRSSSRGRSSENRQSNRNRSSEKHSSREARSNGDSDISHHQRKRSLSRSRSRSPKISRVSSQGKYKQADDSAKRINTDIGAKRGDETKKNLSSAHGLSSFDDGSYRRKRSASDRSLERKSERSAIKTHGNSESIKESYLDSSQEKVNVVHKKRDKDKERDRDSGRDKNKERDNGRDREKDKDKDKDKERDSGRDREKDKDKDKERDSGRDKNKEKDNRPSEDSVPSGKKDRNVNHDKNSIDSRSRNIHLSGSAAPNDSTRHDRVRGDDATKPSKRSKEIQEHVKDTRNGDSKRSTASSKDIKREVNEDLKSSSRGGGRASASSSQKMGSGRTVSSSYKSQDDDRWEMASLNRS